MAKVKYSVIMYESKDGIPGLCTTHKTKEVMCAMLNERLDQNSVCFYEGLVAAAGTRSREKIIKELCTQVQNYNIVYSVPEKMQHFQFSKKTYSGKHHGNDDMAVMLQFNLLAHSRFFETSKYNRHW